MRKILIDLIMKTPLKKLWVNHRMKHFTKMLKDDHEK